MHGQRTLTELKCRADEAFAEAQDAIDTARRLTLDCRRLNADLKRSIDEFRQFGLQYPYCEERLPV